MRGYNNAESDYFALPRDPDKVTECDWCGDDILEFDIYYAIEGEHVCESCFNEFCIEHKKYAHKGESYEG